MEIRIGTTLKTSSNIVAEIPLPWGFKLVIFHTHGGAGALAYIFPPMTGGSVTSEIMDAAEIAASAFGL